MRTPRALLWILIAISSATLRGQGGVDWNKPFPAHKVIGNVYYVGSKDLASYLITTPEGHILINSGFEETVPLIRDVRRVARLQDSPTSRSCSPATPTPTTSPATPPEGADRREGLRHARGRQDVASGWQGQCSTRTAAGSRCPVDRVLEDGDEVKLGGVTLVARRTPGHTRGCTTWTWKVEDGGKTYDVVVIGSPNVNPGYRLVGNKDYPEIADDFARRRSRPCERCLRRLPRRPRRLLRPGRKVSAAPARAARTRSSTLPASRPIWTSRKRTSTLGLLSRRHLPPSERSRRDESPFG